MCVALLALKQHPLFPLVLLANREEFLDRPTRPLSPWPGLPEILAGQDLQAGGTWLGAQAQGAWGLLTNFHGGASVAPGAPSRGQILVRYLEHQVDFQPWLEQRASQYAGFNLLLGRGLQIDYFSNQSLHWRSLQPGIYGLSNALLDEPWPRVEWGKARLAELLQRNPLRLADLYSLLTHPDLRISPIQGYGSRSGHLILQNARGELSLGEVQYHDDECRGYRLTNRSWVDWPEWNDRVP